MKAVLGAVLAVVGLALGGAVAAATPAQDPPTAEGTIIDFELQAPGEPVPVGTEMTWTNTGDRPHTVTDRGGLFDSGEIQPGQSATVSFDLPGNYEIFCQINPSTMNATIVVEAGPEPPPAVRVQAFDEAREGESRRFDPDALEVIEGTELVMANVGGLRHTLAVGAGEKISTGLVEPGAEEGRFAGSNASLTAPEPGTYPFFCEIHPNEMRGTLVVQPDPDSTTTTEPATTTTDGDDDGEPPDDGDDGDDGDDEVAGEVGTGDVDGGGDGATDGTLVAYLLAAVVVFTGVAGLGLGLRRR